jgi:hypothetical protein
MSVHFLGSHTDERKDNTAFLWTSFCGNSQFSKVFPFMYGHYQTGSTNDTAQITKVLGGRDWVAGSHVMLEGEGAFHLSRAVFAFNRSGLTPCSLLWAEGQRSFLL